MSEGIDIHWDKSDVVSCYFPRTYQKQVPQIAFILSIYRKKRLFFVIEKSKNERNFLSSSNWMLAHATFEQKDSSCAFERNALILVMYPYMRKWIRPVDSPSSIL